MLDRSSRPAASTIAINLAPPPSGPFGEGPATHAEQVNRWRRGARGAAGTGPARVPRCTMRPIVLHPVMVVWSGGIELTG